MHRCQRAFGRDVPFPACNQTGIVSAIPLRLYCPTGRMESSETSKGRATRFLLPSVSHWLWLFLFVMLLSQPWRTAMVASDGDSCMHWRVGEWMLENRQIIRTDVFSHTK